MAAAVTQTSMSAFRCGITRDSKAARCIFTDLTFLYFLQDELAETQVPSPGYTGVYDEIAMEGFEYDVYEYFGELEYGSDSYWDARMKHLESVGLGGKRKSEDAEHTEAGMVKKRRKDGERRDVEEVRDNVVV